MLKTAFSAFALWFIMLTVAYTLRFNFASPFAALPIIGAWQLEAFIPTFLLSPLITLSAIGYYRWRNQQAINKLNHEINMLELRKERLGGEVTE